MCFIIKQQTDDSLLTTFPVGPVCCKGLLLFSEPIGTVKPLVARILNSEKISTFK
jgi:hypothetical protein